MQKTLVLIVSTLFALATPAIAQQKATADLQVVIPNIEKDLEFTAYARQLRDSLGGMFSDAPIGEFIAGSKWAVIIAAVDDDPDYARVTISVSGIPIAANKNALGFRQTNVYVDRAIPLKEAAEQLIKRMLELQKEINDTQPKPRPTFSTKGEVA